MDNLYLSVAAFCFKLVRSLHFVDFSYNQATKRFERHPQNPLIRQRIHHTLFTIVTVYSIAMLMLPIAILYNMPELILQMGEYALVNFAFFAIAWISTVVNLSVILYQFQRRSNSKFLNNFFNKIMELHEKAATLPNHVASTALYTYIHLLLLLKFLLLIWICVIAAGNFAFFSNDVIGFPIFELVFFGNFMIIWKFLRFHENLNRYITEHEDELEHAERCTEQCKQSNDPFLHALTLWWQSKKLFVCFLERFRWFEKVVVSEKLQIIFMFNQMLKCQYDLCFICKAQLPKCLAMILDALLIALINDTLKAEENKLQDILIIIVGKLTKRGLLCAHCNDLLYLVSIRNSLIEVKLKVCFINRSTCDFLKAICEKIPFKYFTPSFGPRCSY